MNMPHELPLPSSAAEQQAEGHNAELAKKLQGGRKRLSKKHQLLLHSSALLQMHQHSNQEGRRWLILLLLPRSN